MNIKQQLYNLCFEFIENRLLMVQKTISEIQESLLSETKSSAGDKHETGRAMLQLEREKAGNQLAEILKTKQQLLRIDTIKSSEKINLGSVVKTTQAYYYLAISAGNIKVDNQQFYAISPLTPIGQLLIGKTVNDEIIFNNNSFTILEVI